jgi:hypothetical protein
MDIPYIEIQKWGYSDVLFTILFGKRDVPPSKIVLQTSLVASCDPEYLHRPFTEHLRRFHDGGLAKGKCFGGVCHLQDDHRGH